jgi:hypothetical protein
VIGGCANTNAKMVIHNKVFTPIYYPNLSRNYSLHLIWYTNIFYASELKLSDILSEFSCRNDDPNSPFLKIPPVNQSGSNTAIFKHMCMKIHSPGMLTLCQLVNTGFKDCSACIVKVGQSWQWLDFLILNIKALHFFQLILFKVGTEYPRDLQSSSAWL